MKHKLVVWLRQRRRDLCYWLWKKYCQSVLQSLDVLWTTSDKVLQDYSMWLSTTQRMDKGMSRTEDDLGRPVLRLSTSITNANATPASLGGTANFDDQSGNTTFGATAYSSRATFSIGKSSTNFRARSLTSHFASLLITPLPVINDVSMICCQWPLCMQRVLFSWLNECLYLTDMSRNQKDSYI